MCDAAMPVVWLQEGMAELWISCSMARPKMSGLGPRTTSLHPPQRAQPVDVPRQDQDVGLSNRAIGSRRRRQALLPDVPQPEQGHPVTLLKRYRAYRLADDAG